MKKIVFSLFSTFFHFFTTQELVASPSVFLTQTDNLFVRITVPDRGIVCSNQDRVKRISSTLKNVEIYHIPWGYDIYIGDYRNTKVFIASAPVGSGSGLMFTELYAAGAKYIVRFGSDDEKLPTQVDTNLIKIITETDNLYGFNQASGIDPEEWGTPVSSSPLLLERLEKEASRRSLPVEKRICHHLENYHALRTPEKFSPERQKRIESHLKKMGIGPNQKGSMDMESAVLFRVAKDFDLHAISVLQTVDKGNKKLGPYEGKNNIQALDMEKLFTDYILSALVSIK